MGQLGRVITPLLDWKETAKEHILKANLPGVKKQDVRVQVEGGRTLYISGERKEFGIRYVRREELPEVANAEEAWATLDRGVLTIVIPKFRTSNSRKMAFQIPFY